MASNGNLPQSDALDLAWLAGWLEGEGCFHVGQRTDGRPRFLVQADSSDRDVVERAAAIAGVGHARKAPGGTNRQMWRWRVDRRADALAVARLLRPHMGARRTAAIDKMLAIAEANPPVAPTHAQRSRRAKKMWQTRKALYGPTGMRAA